MKKPVIDYSKFRLSKINDKEFSHLKLLFGWVVYFALYILTEKFIPQKECYVLHSKLDDVLPFCEWFIIPYVLWYLFVAWSLLYFMLYNVESFKKLMIYLIIMQITAMAIYIIFPNRQDLRPEFFPRDNFLTDAVKFLYTIDTDTNVCPSMHVGFSLAITSVWLKEKGVSFLCKTLTVVFTALICMTVSFIKQHSVIDTFAAFALCAVLEIIVFGKYYWKEKILPMIHKK